MGDYATAASHVAPLLGGRSFGTDLVTEAQADAWIDEAERELIGTIAASGGLTDYTADTTHATLIIRHWVATYVAGRCRRAFSAAVGDADNPDGQEEITGWRDLLAAIRSNTDHFVNMLSNSASQSVAGIRSHAVSTDTDTSSFKMTEVF